MRISDWSSDVCSSDLQVIGIDIAVVERDLLGAGDLEALPLFDRAHERARVVQAAVGAGVEPGIDAPPPAGAQVAAIQIGVDDVGEQIGRASCRASVSAYV